MADNTDRFVDVLVAGINRIVLAAGMPQTVNAALREGIGKLVEVSFMAHRKDVILEVLFECDAIDPAVAARLSERIGVMR